MERPQRIRKAPRRLDDEIADCASNDTKKRKITHKTKSQARSTKIANPRPAVAPSPTPNNDPPAPATPYLPPLGRIELTPLQPLINRQQSPIQLFWAFFGLTSLSIIAAQTNEFVRLYRPIASRYWRDVTTTEIARWIGIRFYMGRHQEHLYRQFWCKNVHSAVRAAMPLFRYEQITRYLHINSSRASDQAIPTRTGSWLSKLEPLYSEIRERCRSNVNPASKVAVDESIVPFSGRCRHTVKLRRKPVSQGIKIWVGASTEGYRFTWRAYSRRERSEVGEISLNTAKHTVFKKLAPTRFSVYEIAAEMALAFGGPIVVYLDNLFTSFALCSHLLAIDVAVVGTAKSSGSGLPASFVKRAELMGSPHQLELEQVGDTLCFAWVDNKLVFGMTTALDASETIQRMSRRPGESSTNAKVMRPLWGDQAMKELPIPTVIDDYNHHMNGVDISNQLPANFSCYRPKGRIWWRTIFYWLIDTCEGNAYILWRSGLPQRQCEQTDCHQQFYDSLVKSLLN